MLLYIISSLSGIVTIMILDYIWLAQVAKSFYLEKLASHITVENGSLVPYVPAIPLFYIIAIISIWVFALSRATTLIEALLWGGLVGFLMYAFYDFTNLATLKDYPWSLTLVDIVWGTLLMSVTTGVIFYVKNMLIS